METRLDADVRKLYFGDLPMPATDPVLITEDIPTGQPLIRASRQTREVPLQQPPSRRGGLVTVWRILLRKIQELKQHFKRVKCTKVNEEIGNQINTVNKPTDLNGKVDIERLKMSFYDSGTSPAGHHQCSFLSNLNFELFEHNLSECENRTSNDSFQSHDL